MRLRRVLASAVSIALLTAAFPAFAAGPAKKVAASAAAAPAVPPEAAKLIEEAITKGKAQKFPEAVDLLQQALAILEKKLGPDHYLLGNTLNLLAQIETIQGHIDIAIKHAERSITILKKDVNADPLRLGQALIRRAEIYREQGRGDDEITLRKLAINLFERAFGPESIDALAEVLALARALTHWGQYDEAKIHYDRWIKVIEKLFGFDEPVLVEILLDYANSEMLAGHYAEAEVLLSRALAIRKKQGLTRDEDVPEILNNLAEVAYQRGEYVKAEGLYERVLAVYEKKPGVHPQTLGIVLGNLGSVRLDLGRSDEALKLLQKALEIQEAHFGANHAALVTPLSNLGEALLRTGKLGESIPYLERALVLREKALGPNHPRLATPLINLGSARLDEGKIPEAEAYFLRAQAIEEKTVGPDHPLMFQVHQAMGILEQNRKNYTAAEERHGKALAVLEKAFGPMHPDLVAPLKSMAVILTLRKDFVGARKALERAGNIAEKQTKVLLSGGAEHQKRAWLATIEPLWSLTVEHQVRHEPKVPEAARLAFEATLRRKGRALDAVAANMSALRRRLAPEDAAMFDELRAKQKKYASMMVGGIPLDDVEAWRNAATTLGREIDQLQEKLNDRSAAIRVDATDVNFATFQALLPKDASYVEIVLHSTGWALLPGETAKTQYTAYVLKPEGDPQSIELGEAAAIDTAVEELRKALSDPTRQDAKRLSRALDEKVMRPIRAALGNTQRLILAPDGALDFVPFEAFLDENNQFLIERYSLSYVTSGRDLFRWQLRVPSRSAPEIVANPAFGTITRRSPTTANRSSDTTGISRLGFNPLVGTAEEGKAIAKQLSGARLHMEKDANKATLISVAGPKLLHIATHGFFMGDTLDGTSRGTRGFTLEGEPPKQEARAVSLAPRLSGSPMLRSGVALSGANEHGELRGEGILTALEASGLDLEGTKLVVLSACETGLGSTSLGEGVMGLRRAFVLAGAETTVMSLWKVDDRATRDMMIGYYQRLEAGGARGEALRDVRLQMLHDEATAHPFYWASFIVSGDPSRFDGSMPAVPAVSPGARGCACFVVGDGGDENGGVSFLFVAVGGMIGIWRRRRAA